MSAESASHSSNPPRPRSLFNNWISAIGGVISAGAFFSFALLVWMDFTQGDKNPYLGILTYLVAPAFLIAGLAVVFFGAWAQRRWQIKHAATMPDKWRLDFTSRKQRRGLVLFGSGAALFLGLSAFGSYRTYHYAESTQFCGEVCHLAMNPELTAYKRGAHARVSCVECHVGSGAQWFVKAKINGVHQLVAYTLDNYKRPIETPLKNLRPAQDTCEKCHWPEKFYGNIDVSHTHFLSDKKNTPYEIRLLMRVNQGQPGGQLQGIHWHVNTNHRVEYFAADDKRQDIPWMRVTDLKTGEAKIYQTAEFKTTPPADKLRVMDCMDCHNRPAHAFPTANEVVESAIQSRALDSTLPSIKRVAVQAMTETGIKTDAEAPAKIAEFMAKKYPGHPALAAATAEVQRLYAVTIFPERKADWRVYPDNLGHKDWLGCFRCHNENLKTAEGKSVPANDCNACHIILTQGSGSALDTLSAKGLEFKHPDGDFDSALTCSDCHNGGIQK